MDPYEALLEAVKKGDTQQVEKLLSSDPHLAWARAQSGESAALLAINYGHSELVDMLLKAGLEVDIFEASAAGKLTLVEQILIHQPGLVNTYAPDGFTPLDMAVHKGHAEAARLLAGQP